MPHVVRHEMPRSTKGGLDIKEVGDMCSSCGCTKCEKCGEVPAKCKCGKK